MPINFMPASDCGKVYLMPFSNTQKLDFSGNNDIQPGWYNAIFVRHQKKSQQEITFFYFEFQLSDKKKKIWGILPQHENYRAKFASLKQALGMSDQDTDFAPYYEKSLQIYIEKIVHEGKTKYEVTDYAGIDANQTRGKTGSAIQMPRQILIVDDQLEVANLIGNYVRQLGFIPVLANTVDEALHEFEPDKYFMVISDVMMPGKNGFDIVRFMHNRHPQTSVALISGYVDKEMENLQKVFGIEKIYKKPVFLNSVKEMIANALQKANMAPAT
jgi:CheY-like chemotaxis protein